MLMGKTGNECVLIVVVVFPGFKIILIDLLLVLSHVSVHFERVFLLHLDVQVLFVTFHIVVLDRGNLFVHERILGELSHVHRLLVISVCLFLRRLRCLAVAHLLHK